MIHGELLGNHQKRKGTDEKYYWRNMHEGVQVVTEEQS